MFLALAAALLVVVGGRWAAAPPAGRGGANTVADSSDALRIDVNAADAMTLELLPGIGPALADRIIEERTAGGPFTSVQDLRRVRGIGPKRSEDARPFVRFGEAVPGRAGRWP